MIIQYLNGGLANQTFQYIFSRYVEMETKEICYLDDSFFFYNQIHNGYELERVFGVKPHLLSEYFHQDTWRTMVEKCKAGTGIAQQLLDSGMNLFLIAETTNFEFSGNTVFAPKDKFTREITWIQGNAYYHGYWLNKQWYEKNETLRKELRFPQIRGLRNLKYVKQIVETNSVAVHIRRGDFVTLQWALPPALYKGAMKTMSEHNPAATYFIFSDDILWCKEHADDLGFEHAEGRLVFVEGNTGEKSYIDMQLMSLCAGMIVSNSSFCYMAAMFNKRMQKNFIKITDKEL